MSAAIFLFLTRLVILLQVVKAPFEAGNIIHSYVFNEENLMKKFLLERWARLRNSQVKARHPETSNNGKPSPPLPPPLLLRADRQGEELLLLAPQRRDCPPETRVLETCSTCQKCFGEAGGMGEGIFNPFLSPSAFHSTSESQSARWLRLFIESFLGLVPGQKKAENQYGGGEWKITNRILISRSSQLNWSRHGHNPLVLTMDGDTVEGKQHVFWHTEYSV